MLDVANQLERSARHEERLLNDQGAKKLAAQAESVTKAGKGSVNQAREQLSSNAENTKTSERQQSDSVKNEDLKATFNRPEASEAQLGLNKSAQELAAQSKQISQLLGEMNGSLPHDSKSNSGNRTDTQQGLSIPRELKESQARDMARMLDVLDRQLNSDANQSEQSSESQADAKDEESKSDGEKTPPGPKAASSKPSGSMEDRNGSRSSFKDSIKSSSDKLSSSMGQERLAHRAESQSQSNARNQSHRNREQASNSKNSRSSVKKDSDFSLPGLSGVPNRDWGKLRDQRVEDAVEGQRDEFDPEFSQAIRAYYKALGNP